MFDFKLGNSNVNLMNCIIDDTSDKETFVILFPVNTGDELNPHGFVRHSYCTAVSEEIFAQVFSFTLSINARMNIWKSQFGLNHADICTIYTKKGTVSRQQITKTGRR